jgi:RNA polymerase sigma-70 factor, ECF subfamily
MIPGNAPSFDTNFNTYSAALEPHEAGENWLVEAARRGHSTAFATLCQRYTQQLLRAAHRITKSREDAEDAVQDALLRGFVHVRDFNGRSSFGTWLTRIAINSALMILRKKRTSMEVAMESDDDGSGSALSYEIPDRTPNPEKRYAQHEEQRILIQAIGKLRPSLQETVRMQHLQERSVRETAELMGISVSAAKARLFHAKAALRKSPILKATRRLPLGRRMPVLSAA